MSDTPEIDSIIVQRLCIHKRDSSIQHMELIDAEVARKLKRERDEATTKLERISIELQMWRDGNIMHENHKNELEKAERERNEAREKLNEEMKWHHRTHKELVEAQCKLLDMEYDKLKS